MTSATQEVSAISEEAATVALLALSFQEAAQGSLVGPRTSGDDLLEDLQYDPSRVSLLTYFASAKFGEADWAIVRAFNEGRMDDARELLAEADPSRVEAIFHAFAAGREFEELPVPSSFYSDGFVEMAKRWEEVELAMEQWRKLGITATREDVHAAYIGAMRNATGLPTDAIIDSYLDATEEIG
jgi:hypothetical protein